MAVEPMEDYKLILTFRNGEKRVFDFLPMLDHKINKPLKNLRLFMKARRFILILAAAVVLSSVAWAKPYGEKSRAEREGGETVSKNLRFSLFNFFYIIF